MKKSAAITRAARPTVARKVKNRLLCADFILPSFGNRRAPPKTTFRSWVDGGSSVFGGDDFIAVPFVDVFLTFEPLLLLGFRWSFLVLIFASNHGTRSSTSKNPSGCADG